MIKRDKLFGQGRTVPLDREAKVRLLHRAKVLMRATEPRKAYGLITAKAFAVLQALLYGFHNAHSGRCFPSYEAIADRAGCCRSSVAMAIKLLERTGLLQWHNRIIRVRQNGVIRVVRTSNAYQFPCPTGSKSEIPTGTQIKFHSNTEDVIDPPLTEALRRLGELIRKKIRNP